MQRKTFSVVVMAAALLCLALGATPVLSQDDMTQLAPEAFENPQRPPSVFVHDAHNEKAGLEECYVCHHMDGSAPDPDDTSEGTPCADCHDLEGGDGATGLIDAYHKQCKGCHEKEGKGPVACGECHVRK